MIQHKWLDPSECLPPHAITHPEKVDELARMFKRGGWSPQEPSLVGYPYYHLTQLLSGSHRHAAALLAGIRVPVVIVPNGVVESRWGRLAAWQDMMRMGDRR